jgi:GNAT superfamily N-acetyltransferase
MRIGWEGLLRHGSAGLSATWTTDDLAGAAMWIPPERSASSAIENLRLIYSLGRFAGWRRLPQVSSLYTFVEKRRHHHLPGPHAYLAGIGVDPARQGGGNGTALLRPMIERADREGFPAYLETGTARNLPFYERAGFRIVEELTLPNTAISGWLMVRDAPTTVP